MNRWAIASIIYHLTLLITISLVIHPQMVMHESFPSFSIGRLPVYGELALSPMDGFSDQPFRSICHELGSALSYTEFINAIDVEQRSHAPLTGWLWMYGKWRGIRR
jgi:hypothetical protein